MSAWVDESVPNEIWSSDDFLSITPARPTVLYSAEEWGEGFYSVVMLKVPCAFVCSVSVYNVYSVCYTYSLNVEECWMLAPVLWYV